MTDGSLDDSQTFSVIVNAVNDAPVASAASATTSEDQNVVVPLTASDIDGDVLTYSLDTDASNGSVTIEGSLVTYVPDQDFNGSDSFTFSVSDGEYTASAEITVTVNAINDVPVITSLAPATATEDIEYSYQVDVEDPDNASFDFTLDNAPD